MFLWPKKRFPNVNRLRLHPHPFLPHLASFSLWLNHFAVALSHCFSLQISCSSRRWHLLDISINELQVQKKKKREVPKTLEISWYSCSQPPFLHALRPLSFSSHQHVRWMTAEALGFMQHLQWFMGRAAVYRLCRGVGCFIQSFASNKSFFFFFFWQVIHSWKIKSQPEMVCRRMKSWNQQMHYHHL